MFRVSDTLINVVIIMFYLYNLSFDWLLAYKYFFISWSYDVTPADNSFLRVNMTWILRIIINGTKSELVYGKKQKTLNETD
jgi:hypothetical protein